MFTERGPRLGVDQRVYLEAYTSVLGVDQAQLEAYYGKPIQVADRERVESSADDILDGAATDDVAFLVVGDPFGATTHMDLVLRARERGITCQPIHNASILNAVGCCGLQLYNFGQTVSLVFFTEAWQPDSFYDKIKFNASGGLHTLCLLDIRVKEPDLAALARGRVQYEPPRFMTVAEAAQQLLDVEQRRGEGVCPPHAVAVGLARVGRDDQRIVAATLHELSTADLGPPLHALVVVGQMHFLERDALMQHALDAARFSRYANVTDH